MLQLSVLDLSTRLPGPLAAKLLGDLGASVTRLENDYFPDPFKCDENNRFDHNFKNWYAAINQNKKIITTNKKSPELEEELVKLIEAHDIIICSLPDKLFPTKIGDALEEKAFIQIRSSKEQTPLHDLNILAESGLLDYHLKVTNNNSLPFIPLAGVIFAEAITQKAQATYIEALKTKRFIKKEIFLDEVIQSHLNFLLTDEFKSKKETHYLHTGKFPCYNIYQFKDGKHLALAAIESKYWKDFLKLFGLRQNLDQFDPNTEQDLRRLFINLKSDDISDVQSLKNCCATIF